MLKQLQQMQKSALHRMAIAEKAKNREYEKYRISVEEVNTINRLIKRERGTAA